MGYEVDDKCNIMLARNSWGRYRSFWSPEREIRIRARLYTEVNHRGLIEPFKFNLYAYLLVTEEERKLLVSNTCSGHNLQFMVSKPRTWHFYFPELKSVSLLFLAWAKYKKIKTRHAGVVNCHLFQSLWQFCFALVRERTGLRDECVA
jgi:hypothetical protein